MVNNLNIVRYAFEDSDGNEVLWTTFDYEEALQHAKEHEYLLIEQSFVFEDNDYLADYRIAAARRARPVYGL